MQFNALSNIFPENHILNRKVSVCNLVFAFTITILIIFSLRAYGDKISMENELGTLKTESAFYNKKENLLKFADMFIDSVLKIETEVDFDTRLKLENAVRDLKDDKILNQWNKFVNSKTTVESQDEVTNLLSLIVKKSVKK